MTLISVIIPCRNENRFIEECLNAVYQSDLPDNTEMQVCVIDGMSDDGTRETIISLQSKFPQLRLIDNLMKVKPFALNLGIEMSAQADYFQIVDVRQIISSNYLKECVNRLETDKSTWCVGGKIINEYPNKMGTYIAKAMSTSFGMGLGNFRTLSESGYTDTVTCQMYPMWIFEKVGNFDEELVRNQDDEFNYRVVQAGGKIFYDTAISLKYYGRGDLKQLWKQFLQYGYWKVYVNKKHKAVTTLRQLVPPAFVFFLFLVPFLFLINLFLGYIGASVLGFYLFLNLAVSAINAKSMDEFTSIVVIFPLLHISYGWGYLKGIFDFVILNRKPNENQKKLSR
ncbi:MAG: glycosyltransferase family 2 protein [Fluviicola sp.]